MPDSKYILQIVVEGQDRASGPLGGIGGVLGRMGEIAGGILGAGLLQNIAQGVLTIGRNAIESTAQLQTFNMGLASLVARELRSADSTLTLNDALDQAGPLAEKLAGQLKNIAIQSPYRLGTVQDTFRLAMAFGFASDEAMSFTNGILNMAAGVGATDEVMGRMAYNLAQIRMQGKVTAVDVRQLAMAGLDLNGVLSGIGQQFGLSIKDYNDFNAAIASGKITWEQFAGSFEKYANEQFGGAAARMSRTFEGLKSTFADVFTLTMPAIFGPALQRVTDFLNGILNKFIEFANNGTLDEAGKKLGEFTDKVFDYLDNLTAAFNDAGPISSEFFEALTAGLPQEAQDKITGFFKEVFNPNVMAGFQTTVGNIQTAFANLQTFFSTYGPGIIQVIGEIFGGAFQKNVDLIATKLTPFISGVLVKLSAWFNQNGPLIQTYLENAKVVIGYLLNAFVGLWAVLEPLLTGAVDLILSLATAFMQLGTGDVAGAWKTVGDAVVGALGSIWQALVAAVDWILGLFGSSLSDVGQWFTDTWNGIVTSVTTWWTNMISAISAGSSNASASFTEWLASVGQWFTDAWNNIVLFFQNLWINIKTAFIAGVYGLLDAVGITEEVRARIAAIWDRIVAIAGVLWDRITAAISVGWAAFTTWITELWNSIWTPLSTAFTLIWNTITAAMSFAWNAIVTVATIAWNLLTSTIQTIIGKVVGFISPILENIKTTLKTTWENIKTTVSTKFTEIVTTVSTKIGEVLTNISGTVTKFIDAGKQIVGGILDGIKAKWQSVIDWVLDGIERLLSRIENALDMHSPSRRMEGLFENVPLGAAQGIRNKSDEMGKAMSQAIDQNVLDPSLNLSRIYNSAPGSSSSSVVNQITIEVSGADDPDAVANAIFARLKANGVMFA
jgi:tape measure domain-containing protein